MTSIFACYMRGFNQPRKHNAVKYWVKEEKINLGFLVETRVHDNFQKGLYLYFLGLAIFAQLQPSLTGKDLSLLV